MDAPLISVIVPVYKVEAYLDRCVQSIVDQTYQNLEIILVDDGSPDNCPAICDAWAAKDSRIKVIHQENGGLSHARNAGMAVATGNLIGFVDSDDHIAPNMYQLLYENMAAYDSDISACGVEMMWEDGTPSRMLTPSGSTLLNTQDAMAAVIEESWLKQPVWYKLYKAPLVLGTPFPIGKYHEDVFWTYQVVSKAQRVSVFDTPCYHYLQRSGSIMGAHYSLKRLDALEAKLLRLDFLKQHFPSLVGCAEKDLLFTCLYHGQLVLISLHGDAKKEAMQKIHQVLKRCPLPDGVDYNRLPFTHKCWLKLAKFSLPLACRLRNLLSVGS